LLFATADEGDRMNRRKLIGLLAGASLARSTATQAQQIQKVPIIGFLHPGFSESGSPILDAIREELRDAGYVEGETAKLEARWARGKPEMLPQLAQELVQLPVDVLVAAARPSIEAARAATTVVPIVANDLESDPVASGYVASLAHPGGNLTGLFLDAPTLCGKWLQQMGDIVPNVKKIAVLWDTTTGTYQRDAINTVARTASIDLVVMEFRDAPGLETALNLGLKEAPQAVIQLGSPLTRQAGPRVAEILSGRRIPGISQFRSFPDGGGLMSYGPDLVHLFHRVGPFVSKILKGARPADLPIERPTKFELVINLKAAKALAVTIPSSLLATVDDVIE
jgi:putative tryptophan/tyrosine transport system substrate-binding protein